MITIRMEYKPAFKTYGRKTWVGQDNEAFARFWAKCKEEGLLDLFSALQGNVEQSVTHSVCIGISRVEKDPAERNFWFYVAAECEAEPEGWNLEEYTVPASRWAIFEHYGPSAAALIEAEIYAFTEWLPNSPYVHAMAPEIEVYPPRRTAAGACYEFWLPIREKN